MKEKFKKKILWMLIELIIAGILIAISIIFSNSFANIANIDYAKLIIETAIILASFGLIAFQYGKEDKLNWLAWADNLKAIILYSIISVILAFSYIIYSKSIWSFALFQFSSVFLFISLFTFILFLIFHKNKYINEVEK